MERRERLYDGLANGSEPPEGSEGSEGSKTSPEGSGTIKARIRKLLATGFHPTTGAQEAQAALALARKLMAKHKLTPEEVFAANNEPDPPQRHQWPEPVDGKALIKDLCRLLHRHIVMSQAQEMAVALWIIHAHAHDAARRSPILMITAPEWGCAKTQLLEFVSYLVPRPWVSDNPTAAAIFDEIERSYATIMLDEGETYLVLPRHIEMRGIINSSWRRGGTVRRKGVKYSTWAPIVIALNGRAHETTASRSIVVRLERRLPDESVEPLVEPDPEDENNPFVVLRRKCARWAADNVEALRKADPALPDGLHNREADNWRPALAIAEACKLPKTGRNAARAIASEKLNEKSISEQLLRDLKPLLTRQSPMLSVQITDALNSMEAGPWATCMRGAPLTTTYLAQLLKTHLVVPGEVKVHGRRGNGYRIEQFNARQLFERYAAR